MRDWENDIEKEILEMNKKGLKLLELQDKNDRKTHELLMELSKSSRLSNKLLLQLSETIRLLKENGELT